MLLSEEVNQARHFPAGITFKYPWRRYQQRVLEELGEHLADDHLHVIAPPGSGKTVLGLEVALRINKPTLILAPTVAIKNQWVQRFCELFLQTSTPPDWLSRDIRNPRFLTVATYQGLHAACNFRASEEKEEEEGLELEEEENNPKGTASKDPLLNEIVDRLKEQQVGTIVVDEAHHLKNEWWKTLTAVKKALSPTLVGLTATPPYDVSPQEWQRYTDLNGPVDTEISVPELVVEGDLCPHQDYVYLSRPTAEEGKRIGEFRDRMERLFQELRQDRALVEAISRHPIITQPFENLDWIYANLACYSASLIFLKANGLEVTAAHLEVIGDNHFPVPDLDYEWLETLLSFYLHVDPKAFPDIKDHQEALEKKLKRNGALDHRKITLRHNPSINGLLSASLTKLDSITQIVTFEYGQLREDLRMVVLSDYIRKEFMPTHPEHQPELNKIGVIPIFEKLRRQPGLEARLGVLTGSLVILPRQALPLLQELAAVHGLAQIRTLPLPFAEDYLLLQPTEAMKHELVRLVTEVFQQGGVQVLIGTKSLLGEGWDAPAINSLILASFVGSFVLSNQMRGRAIRTQRGNDGKTGNIWHLASVDPTFLGGGDDLQLLARRFRGFVGVSFREEPGIENGIGRLNLPRMFGPDQDLDQFNQRMLDLAGRRDELQQRWQEALAGGVNLVEEIKVPFAEEKSYQRQKMFYFRKTIAYLLAELGMMATAYGYGALQGFGRSARNINTWEHFYYSLGVVLLAGMWYMGKELYTSFRLFLKYRDIAKDLHGIGEALLSTLSKARVLHTPQEKLNLYSKVDSMGAVYCHLEGGTTFDKSIFIKSLQEVIGTVNNPRYVIIRQGKLFRLLHQRDHHPVPEVIGRNKVLAKHFREAWENQVGSCELVFTRTPEGRRLLLKARLHSLAYEFTDKSERVNVWR